MADVGAILESKESQDSWYDPRQDFSGPMPEGEYKAHVKSLNIKRNVVVKRKFLSDIYEVIFTVADENSDMEYQDDKGETLNGATFVGRDFRSKGFFFSLAFFPTEYSGSFWCYLFLAIIINPSIMVELCYNRQALDIT